MSAAVALTAIALALALAPAALASASSGAPSSSSVVFRLPFLAGQSFPVTQGWHGSFSHTGTAAYAYDFGLPEGTPVVAAAPGVVKFVEAGHRACGGVSLRTDGNAVTIYHADGSATLYAHLSKVSVKVGQVVTGGERIGLSGKTGFTNCEAHLHFARQRQGKAVTQSIRVYFAETGHQQLGVGAVATSENPVCSQSTAGLPDDAFCAVYTTTGHLGALEVTRLEHGIAIGSMTSADSQVGSRRGAAVAATWLGRFTFTASGNYTFRVTSDHDVRVTIDGTVVLDAWVENTPPDGYAVSEWMPTGQHVIQVDYRSGPLPLLRFSWQQAQPDPIVRTLY